MVNRRGPATISLVASKRNERSLGEHGSMAQEQRILIVDNNSRRAGTLRDAIAGSGLPAPVHREDGESAVVWVGANECDLCVLSYALPGINGLETLARMRNRRPDLPAIIIAESPDPNVAIASFRFGVLDFIPISGAWAQNVAERAQELLGNPDLWTTSSPQGNDDPTLAHIPSERRAPTYQNRLRTIGHQLDAYDYHTVTIIEVDGGFLVRAQKARARRPQTLEFPDQDFPRLLASAIHEISSGGKRQIHRDTMTPTGYEDCLRALGQKLDEMSAEAIVITELEEKFVVAGRCNDMTSAVPGLSPFELFLSAQDIETMLNQAFLRRGKQEPRIRQPETGTGRLRSILRRLN
jgi:CheY-like chemotaxis protein